MFVVRFANLSLARYLTNPRVIAWLPALKGPLEPRLLTEILLFWASLKRNRLDDQPLPGKGTQAKRMNSRDQRNSSYKTEMKTIS